MKYIYSLLAIVVLLMTTNCASKRFVNKALKFDEAGLYADAANMYYRSLSANENNIDAKLGLQRTGQLVLEDKIKAFKNQYENGSAKEAVYAYREAESYYNQLAKIGVPLILSEEQRAYYQEVEDLYLNKLYQDGSKALNLDGFSSAEKIFAEILTINNTYKDSKSQWIIAKYEPMYRQGNSLLSSQLYRSAYGVFDQIIKGTTQYKNSLEARKTALDKATLTIALAPFSYSNPNYKSLAAEINTQTVNQINSIEAPFYKIIATNKTTTVSNWKNFKNAYATTAGAKPNSISTKAKSLLSANINNYLKQTGRLIKTEKRGYIKKTIEVINPATKAIEKKTSFSKVRYYEYKKENIVRLTVQYNLKRVDKDELPISDLFNAKKAEKIHYATFEGDYKQLIPGYWKYSSKTSGEDRVDDNKSAINSLQTLFQNKKEIASTFEMQSSVLKQCAAQIASKIENYKPEN